MHQFIHVNTYSRTLSAKAKHAKWNAQEVVAEANREPGAHDHVIRDFGRALPPNHVYGAPITELTATLDEWAAGTKDTRGRAARKDAVCLLSGVFSAPNTISEDAWEAFRDDAVGWLAEKYGDRLQTVIEHRDEDHPHCHFYVVPRPGEKIEAVHEGKRAEKEFIAAGGSKNATNKVFREAMRGFQDEYFESVAVRHGMTRIGPGKRRLTRAEAMKEKQAAAAAAVAINKAETLAESAHEHVEKAKLEAAEVLAAADAKGFESGFAQGIAETEKLPFWKRAKLFFGSLINERDTLKVALEKVTKERDGLVKQKETFLEKFTRNLTIGTRAKDRVEELKTELAKVEPALEQALQRASQVDSLQEALSVESGRAQHWEAVARAHMPEPEQQPTMHVPGDKKKKISWPELSELGQ